LAAKAIEDCRLEFEDLGKTYKTAVVLIPPEDVWPAIQAIRERMDRNFRRWMPHVTLVYPFRPFESFEDLKGPLVDAAKEIEPFEVDLRCFRCFSHRRDSHTVWLDPEAEGFLGELQQAVQEVAPECDDVGKHGGGFTPHLSVGQVRGKADVEEVVAELEKAWIPLRFRAEHIHLIFRGDPPDDVFDVAQTIALG
jgi:2'-5' RNA ligase